MFVIPSFPLPAHSGGTIATIETLRSLADSCNLHVLTPSPETEVEQNLGNLKSILPGVSIHFYQTRHQMPKIKMYSTAALTTLTGKSYWARSWWNRDLRLAVQDLFRAHHFDLVHAEWLHTAVSIWDLNIPLLIRTLDIHFVGMKQWAETISSRRRLARSFWLKQAERFRFFEVKILSTASAVVTLSTEDEMALRHEGVSNVETIPPPRPVIPIQPSKFSLDETRCVAVFIGRLDMAVNREGFFIFVNDIWPKVKDSYRDRVKVIFAGGHPDEFVRQRATEAGVDIQAPLTDLEAQKLFERADLFFSPVTSGTGIKIKTLEALARAKPMIGFSNAYRGVPAKDGRDALIADSSETFARQMEHLISNPKLRLELGRNGQRLIEESFDPVMLGSRLIEAYAKVVRNSHPTARRELNQLLLQ